MRDDRYGLELSTNSAAARDAYIEGVDRLLAAQPGADLAFEQALGHDADFALARAGQARVLQLNNRLPSARHAIARAVDSVAVQSERERGHVAIFDHLLNGRGDEAMRLTEQHIMTYPRDAVALSP